MEPAPRYEILDTIATGDFATVYRARDRELGREVAVKQIHQQFLGNPRQLERYWREAQLLASLQHPNIVTIYDVVRSRGWLVLELMRGSLQRSVESGPIDLDYLRSSLICCLSALGFLHTNGVIHGDVKPSNMLLDSQGRIKLGDFGLARRASNEQGSLLKGTTKYMAPELVSNQFGPVGPASDLYSLGFSAFELMCGPQFDTLFPGLATFGRDRQIAWLMWHAAPDRNLPGIGKVLEGVPPDLARVIQRLTVKDQTRRYHSAQSALRDLRAGEGSLAPAEEKLSGDGLEEPPKAKRLQRIAAVAAMAISLVLCIIMVLPSKPEKAPAEEPQPLQGVIRDVYLREQSLVLEESETKKPVQLHFKLGDKFYVNQHESLLRDLKALDRVKVEYQPDKPGRTIAVVYATRPETQAGEIKNVDPVLGRFTLAVAPGGEFLGIRVPGSVKIQLNGKDSFQGKPVTLADLKPGDRAVVQHVGDEPAAEQGKRKATDLAVLREVTLEGTIREVDAKKRILKIEGAKAERVELPIAEKCEVTLNGSRVLNRRDLKPADLKPGDKATVKHDVQVVRVDAYRTLGQEGKIESVQDKTLEVLLQGEQKPTIFTLAPQCKITLAGETAELADLRAGDAADITHDSPDATTPRALSIDARRPPDPTRWAILIGIQAYDDKGLAGLDHPAADAKLLQETLVKRHRVPPNQALLLEDASLVRLKREIPSLLERVQPVGKLVVYFGGHAFRDDDGKLYLAPKEFNRGQAAATGVSFQWLVDQLEQCHAQEKLLLLDACQAAPGLDPLKEPSTTEMFQTLAAPPGRAALRTVTGIASCSEGQRGQVLSDRKRGLFASSLSQGFAGRADKNRDSRLEATELFAFLGESMAGPAAAIQKPQTAKLFLPDNRPPRLSEDAKRAIRELAVYVQQDSLNLTEAKMRFATAESLAGKEPEPKLLYAMILLKARQRDEAQRHFASLKNEQPGLVLPFQGLAWVQFDKRAYANGVNELADLVAKAPRPKKPTDAYPADVQQAFHWTGQLREFAAAVDERRMVAEEAYQRLDSAAAAHGEAAAQLYEKGRAQSRRVAKDFDARIAAAPDDVKKSKLQIDRRQLLYYTAFPFETAVQSILARLDQ